MNVVEMVVTGLAALVVVALWLSNHDSPREGFKGFLYGAFACGLFYYLMRRLDLFSRVLDWYWP